VESRFSLFFVFLEFCLNNDCLDLWVVDVIRFLTLELKRINFSMGFLSSRPRKMSYLCIELNLFLNRYDVTIEN
jgi:hypothetical protein